MKKDSTPTDEINHTRRVILMRDRANNMGGRAIRVRGMELPYTTPY